LLAVSFLLPWFVPDQSSTVCTGLCVLAMLCAYDGFLT
jgi:hypothetical protein